MSTSTNEFEQRPEPNLGGESRKPAERGPDDRRRGVEPVRRLLYYGSHIACEISERVIATFHPIAFAMAALVHSNGPHASRRDAPGCCVPCAPGLTAAMKEQHRMASSIENVSCEPIALGAGEFRPVRFAQNSPQPLLPNILVSDANFQADT